jgi:hypothetical protein
MGYAAVSQQRQHLAGVGRAWHTQQFDFLHDAISKTVVTSFSIAARSSPASLKALEGLYLKCIVEQNQMSPRPA